MPESGNELQDLVLAITDKHVEGLENKPIEVHRNNISQLLSILSVDQLFSLPYEGSPLRSARVFNDTETVKLIFEKEGVLPEKLAGDRAGAIEKRVQLLDAIHDWDSKKTVQLLDEIGGYKKISDNQAVRRLYKHEIQRNFSKSINELIAEVRADAIQLEEPKLLAGQAREIK